MSRDPYIDPDNHVLRNKLGIFDAEELAQAEADITYVALARLAVRRLPGAYDVRHLRAFHVAIFGDIYPWAGQVRTVRISKGELFCLPQFIEATATERLARLATEKHLRGLDRDRFVDRLTYYFGEVNAIHPFREGNGRTQRAFFGQLATDAGYVINWQRLDAERNVDASVRIMRGDPEPMRCLLGELVGRS